MPDARGPAAVLEARLAGDARARFLLAAASGLAVGLAHEPWGLWPFGLLGFAGLLLAIAAAPCWRAAALAGWLAGAAMFGLTLHWIVEPFLVFRDTLGWMAPFAWGLMAGGLALFWGAACATAWALGLGPVSRMLAVAVCLATLEVVRAHVFTGFPWAHVAYIHLGLPFEQLLALIGPHGLALLTLLWVAAVLLCWRAQAPRGLALAAVLLLVAGAWGLNREGGAPREDDGRPLVRLVQPNAPQTEKWDPERAPVFLRRLLVATAAEPPPDLVVWPESAVPMLLEDAGPVLEEAAWLARGAPVALGVQRREGLRFFNSLVVAGPGGRPVALYDKAHLVPFGEYIPFGDLLGRFGLRGLAAREGGGYTAGPGPALVSLEGIGRALVLICYEGIFPQFVASAPSRPDLMVLVTNDAWFGQGAGPRQHFAQARARAIEDGVPMVRVANTGISGVIDGRGRVSGKLELGRTGHVDVRLPEALAPTPYSRWRSWPALGALALLLGLLGWHRRRFGD
jgi:apolipoprotein N-acyltransferase